MIRNELIRPEVFKQQWSKVQPKVRELWPNLTDQDLQAVNGDLELFIGKVRDKYHIDREDVLTRLQPYFTTVAGADKTEPMTAGKVKS